MKRLPLFICLSLTTLSLQAQEMTFSETKAQLGTIKEEKGDISHDFWFMNTGSKPLIIKSVITGCGCTSAEWSKTAYQPGEKGCIRMTYHPQGRIETEFNLVAEVYTNIPKNGVMNLEIFGKVERKTPLLSSYFNPINGKVKKQLKRAPADDFEKILERIRNNIYDKSNPQDTDKKTANLLQSLTPEGKWSDIDYACFFRTNWEPVDHLKRLVTVATSYTDPRSTFCGNDVLYNAIQKALEYWNQQDPKCHNWWYNQISVPQTQADLFALMDAGIQKISQEVSAPILVTMNQRSNPRKWTGANKMDIAIHHLVRGCLLKNDSIVRANSSEIFYPVKIVDAEGIQKDLSYHQHGPQLYIGGYGTVFVNNIVQMANVLHGTEFAMDDEKLNLFSDFTRNTYLNVFRGRHLDFSVTGRGVSRTNILDYGTSAELFKMLQELDPKHANEYAAVARRFLTQDASYERSSRNKMYECSDYMLHNQKGYDISVRTASTRTNKTESGNGENLYGTYMSDGATNIRVNGNEYTNIFPVWEWDKIPGTTAPTGEKKNPADWGTKGTSSFTGGVSDGKFGVMTFDMNDYGVKARKSWFLLNEGMVCLGAGIESNLPENIVTTVNQCHLDGDVWVSKNNSITKAGNEMAFNKAPEWIWHDSIAYFFPKAENLSLKANIQKGNWSKINYNYSNAEVAMPVFNLTINHGKNPQNESYAYIVIPAINSPEDMKSYSLPKIKIERNDANMQAISYEKEGLMQLVFFSPGSFDNGRTQVKALKPCIVQFKKLNGKVTDVQITDPKNQKKLEVGVDVIIK